MVAKQLHTQSPIDVVSNNLKHATKPSLWSTRGQGNNSLDNKHALCYLNWINCTHIDVLSGSAALRVSVAPRLSSDEANNGYWHSSISAKVTFRVAAEMCTFNSRSTDRVRVQKTRKKPAQHIGLDTALSVQKNMLVMPYKPGKWHNY